MNEQPIQPAQTVPNRKNVLSILSFVFALIAAIGPVAHWVWIGSLLLTTSTTSEAFGAGVLAILSVVLFEFLTLPTLGLASVVLGIIAVARGGNGRKLALASLIIAAVTVVLLIAQMVYWASMGGAQ